MGVLRHNLQTELIVYAEEVRLNSSTLPIIDIYEIYFHFFHIPVTQNLTRKLNSYLDMRTFRAITHIHGLP